MKVKEARKEIDNILEVLGSLREIPQDKMDEIFAGISDTYPEMSWNKAKLHIINSMCAYKNILLDRIDNAELN